MSFGIVTIVRSEEIAILSNFWDICALMYQIDVKKNQNLGKSNKYTYCYVVY